MHRVSTALVQVNVPREEVPPDLQATLEAAVPTCWGSDTEDTMADSAGIEILVTNNARIDSRYLDGFPALRAVVTTGTAFDYVDVAYCRRNGVMVCNTPKYTGASVAEHAFALLLTLNRHTATYDRVARGLADAQPIATELEGKVAGIVGAGDVGTRIARLALGFGMDVRYVNRSRKPVPGARQTELDDLVREADVLFLSLPLTEETRALINAERLGAMKPSAILINVSADELIDLDALRGTLQAGHLAGVGLDIIGDPAPYHDLPRCLITPMKAWYTTEAVHRRAATWINTVWAIAAGEQPHRVA